MKLSRLSILPALPALLALLLGMSATVALFNWTRGQEEAVEQLIFERRANFRIMTVRQGLEELVETLDNVNRAVATFTPISQKQFHDFLEPVARGTPFPSAISILRLLPHDEREAYETSMRQVIPGFTVSELVGGKLAPAGMRDRYLAVEFLEPLDVGGLTGLGFDAMSEPSLKQALARAAETGEAIAAGLFQYQSIPPSRQRFVVVKALYRPDVPVNTSAARVAAVIGYTSIGMPAKGMIAGILDASGMLRTPGVDMKVYMGEDGTDQLAYSDPSDTPGATKAGGWPWAAGSAHRTLSQAFHVAGMSWRVEVTDSGSGSDAGPQPGSWLVALFGAIISVLAALYLLALASRTRRIHHLVAERTAALHSVNARLNSDIAARERVEGMLRRTDRTLKNAQRIAHVGSWEIDMESGVHHWSDECFRIFGLQPTVDGVPDFRTLAPATREMWAAIQEKLLSDGVDSEERSIVRADGSVRHLLLHAELASAGKRTAAGSVLDISDFKRVETELRQSQQSLRELGGHQERIKENERKRIAREIHDELGGVLTGIKAYVSVASSRVGDHAAAPLLAEAMAQADTALDTVRRVIADLRPSVLDQLGVWEAIEWQASQLEAQTGLPCNCYIEADLPMLDADSSAMLFRIVQEALTNIARHAQASSVEIRAGLDAGELLLEVEDDGLGIAFDHLPAQATWGLRGMHERAHYLGGSLRFGTVAGGGTLVCFRLPLLVRLPDVMR